MQLSKDQIASIRCDNMEMLMKASNNSREVMEKFVASNDKYTYDISIDFDELNYKLFLYKKSDLN